ncbi:MAG: hypothetical protein EBZ49_00140 [Proteobacteria bacterium]|nr:hypothetical protein [Pseudomonadota bacterium]
MARYDEDTQKFIDEVSDDRSTKEKLIRGAVNVAKDVARKQPLVPTIARRAVQAGTHKVLEKESNVPVLKLFEELNDEFKDGWWDWEPETLWQTFEGIRPSDELKNMIQALQVVVKTNAAFENWHVFEKVSHAFNENPVLFSAIQPLELDEIAYTHKILKTIRPKEEYEDEVLGYIASCAKRSGVVYLPEGVFPKGCQKFLDDLGNDLSLKNEVAKIWPKCEDGEEAAGVQCSRLSEIVQYVARRIRD